MTTLFAIFISVIIQFGVSTVNDKDPKVSAPSSSELDDYSLTVGSFFVMEKTLHVTKEIYESLQKQPQVGVTLLGKYWVHLVEVWKNIRGYKGYYDISTFGRVKSLERTIHRKNGSSLPVKEKILKHGKNVTKNKKDYYEFVNLRKDGRCKTKTVHRLVIETFLPPIHGKRVTNHIDNVKQNNFLINLEWCNHRENNTYRYQTEDTSSKYTGVSLEKKTKRWKAEINKGKRCKYLGTFLTEEAASQAYQDALKGIGETNKYAVV